MQGWRWRACECVRVCECVCVCVHPCCVFQALEISPSNPPPVAVFVPFFKFLVLHVMHMTVLGGLTLRYCLPNVSLPAPPFQISPILPPPHACRQCLMSTPWAKKQVPLTHSQTALQDTGCAVSTGALNILHFTFYQDWV